MKSILDSAFKYTPSAKTDLRKTFARIRREQRAKEELNRNSSNVVPLPEKEKKP